MIHGGNKKLNKFIRSVDKSVKKKSDKKKSVKKKSDKKKSDKKKSDKKKMKEHLKQRAEPKKARPRKTSSRRSRNKSKRNTPSLKLEGDRGGIIFGNFEDCVSKCNRKGSNIQYSNRLPRSPRPRYTQPRYPQPRSPQSRSPRPRSPQPRSPQPRSPQINKESELTKLLRKHRVPNMPPRNKRRIRHFAKIWDWGPADPKLGYIPYSKMLEMEEKAAALGYPDPPEKPFIPVEYGPPGKVGVLSSAREISALMQQRRREEGIDDSKPQVSMGKGYRKTFNKATGYDKNPPQPPLKLDYV